jgi:hypothetical protein
MSPVIFLLVNRSRKSSCALSSAEVRIDAMRREADRNMQIRTGVGFVGDQFLLKKVLLRNKTRVCSIIVGGSFPARQRLAIRSFLVVFVSCVLLTAQNQPRALLDHCQC